MSPVGLVVNLTQLMDMDVISASEFVLLFPFLDRCFQLLSLLLLSFFVCPLSGAEKTRHRKKLVQFAGNLATKARAKTPLTATAPIIPH